jgi:hypothetical protein
MKIRGY